MRPLARRISVVERHANVGLDYDHAGERYRAYADGDPEKLYDFDGQYGYGDREIWNTIVSALQKLRAKGARELSVVDLGCGPGTWLRRIVDRARQMGFTMITARGVVLFINVARDHPIFVPTPSTSLQTNSRPSNFQQQSLSIAVRSET